jgi:hypothetical protein
MGWLPFARIAMSPSSLLSAKAALDPSTHLPQPTFASTLDIGRFIVL